MKERGDFFVGLLLFFVFDEKNSFVEVGFLLLFQNTPNLFQRKIPDLSFFFCFLGHEFWLRVMP